MAARHFENWLFFLSCWLGSVARAGQVYTDGECAGMTREVVWSAAVAARDSFDCFWSSS